VNTFDPNDIAGRGALARLFQGGVREAERRLAWMSDRSGMDDTPVIRVLEGSLPVRWACGAATAVGAAARSSVALRTVRRAADVWTGLGATAERRLGGIMLLAAVATHVTMQLTQAVPPGWVWLILPGLAFAIGALLLLSSSTGTQAGSAPR